MPNVYLAQDNVDDLARMVMELLSELWIVRDRMAVMEAMFGEKLGLTAQDIDDFAPSPALAEHLETLRDRMVANVVGAPVAAQNRDVDAILERAQLKRSE